MPAVEGDGSQRAQVCVKHSGTLGLPLSEVGP